MTILSHDRHQVRTVRGTSKITTSILGINYILICTYSTTGRTDSSWTIVLTMRGKSHMIIPEQHKIIVFAYISKTQLSQYELICDATKLSIFFLIIKGLLVVSLIYWILSYLFILIRPETDRLDRCSLRNTR